MTPAEAARLNAKYSAFYLTRWSSKSGRVVQVGKPRRTIEEAVAAATRMDRANPQQITFIDIEQPRGRRAV